ncbi:hypothetical protein [Streptomyces sp. NBC_01506]|uniref:hypothetical protein n=1 Tax=Streptomyces sp. NBC_01506 TaxID=2903887 RepID=UPI0038675220
MRVIRRWAPYVALSLILAVAAGYGWYRMSDTGKGWRYEDSLKSFCEGLIPYEESAGLTGKNGSALSRDYRASGSEGDYDSCTVASLDITIGRIPDSARDTGSPEVFDRLDEMSADLPPIPLGGGWRGYTDVVTTATVLTCDNKDGAVVVTAGDDSVDDNSVDDPYDADDMERAHGVAELVAATAVRAAENWGCEAKAGGRIPRLPVPAGWGSPVDAAGTCAGLPLRDQDWVEYVMDAPASGTAPLERCVLGEINEGGQPLLRLEAAFGPYAQRLRSDAPDSDTFKNGAGGSEGSYWATARCPGDGPRAVFQIYPSSDVHIDTKADEIAGKAFVAFAEGRVRQHGCTDLTLPSSLS